MEREIRKHYEFYEGGGVLFAEAVEIVNDKSINILNLFRTCFGDGLKLSRNRKAILNVRKKEKKEEKKEESESEESEVESEENEENEEKKVEENEEENEEEKEEKEEGETLFQIEICGEKVTLGHFRESRVIIRKRRKDYEEKKENYQKGLKERNFAIQLSKRIEIPCRCKEIFHFSKNGKKELVSEEDNKKLQEFYEYLQEFAPSIGRDYPSLVKSTADTHIRNLTRFLQFIEANKKSFKEIKEKIQLDYLSLNKSILFKEKSLIHLSLVLDVVKIYLQHLLDEKNGGEYLKLIIRTIITYSLYYLRGDSGEILSKEEKEMWIYNKKDVYCLNFIKELQMLQRSFQSKYVVSQSREEIEESNRWIEIEELIEISKEYNKEFQLWNDKLSNKLAEEAKLDKRFNRLSNSTKKRVEKKWERDYFSNLSIIQQDALLLSILSVIPPPRSSNIRSLCYLISNKKLQSRLLLNLTNKSEIHTIIEIYGIGDKYEKLMNEYLSILHSNSWEEEQDDIKREMKNHLFPKKLYSLSGNHLILKIINNFPLFIDFYSRVKDDLR